jgi:DNA-binding transcriptional MocR family regulator
LSWQATAWAIKQHETDEPNQRFVLLCLANYAGPDGCNAFPAISTLAEDTGLSESTVRRKLQELEELHLISKGNQAVAAAHIERADRRPIVYDLPLERGVTVLPRELNGVSPESERGVKKGATGCQALTPDPPSDPPINYKKRARESPPVSRAEEDCARHGHQEHNATRSAHEPKKREVVEYWQKLVGTQRNAAMISTLTDVPVEDVERWRPQ